MNSISPIMNIMIKACDKASKIIIRDFGEIENLQVKKKGPKDFVLFPDSVSTRGQKHLKDLIQLKEDGFRSVMLYVVNREDATTFSPAKEIDPTYASLLTQAHEAGVEILVYQTKLTEKEIIIHKKLKVKL